MYIYDYSKQAQREYVQRLNRLNRSEQALIARELRDGAIRSGTRMKFKLPALGYIFAAVGRYLAAETKQTTPNP